MPCSSAPGGTALKAAADRMSRALLPGALISVTLEPPAGGNCNRLVQVSVSGEYNYFFYQLLRAMGNTIPDSLKYRKINKYEVGAPAWMSGLTKFKIRSTHEV